MIILYLTCPNDEEADKISQSLLEKKLIVCAKKFPVSSTFYWKAKNSKTNEILLMLETEERLFDEIESEVRKLHSDETFTLISLPIGRTSKGIKEWMTEGLKK